MTHKGHKSNFTFIVT